MRVFFMLRPKKMYRINPTTGSNNSTVTHASDFTGLRFSERMTHIVTTVLATATTAKAVYNQSEPNMFARFSSTTVSIKKAAWRKRGHIILYIVSW